MGGLKIVFAFLILLLLPPFFSNAQSVPADSTLIATQVNSLGARTLEKRQVRFYKTYNPLKAVLFLFMYGYQSIVSEQISAGCEFERSCSGFSLAAIQELGLLKGICLSADRLTRCNGQAQAESEEYLINHSNGKTIDEPSMYRFKD